MKHMPASGTVCANDIGVNMFVQYNFVTRRHRGSSFLRLTRKRKKGASTTSGNSARMLEVLGQFRVIVKSIRSHYQQVELRSGISGAQLWALAHLAEHPGATVGELAKTLAIHASTASNLVGRLQSLALLSRKRVGGDQRIVRLHLTAKGTRIIERAPRPLIGVLLHVLAKLPAGRLDALHRDLGALIRGMDTKDVRAKALLPLSEI